MKSFLSDRPRLPNKSLTLAPAPDGLAQVAAASASLTKPGCGGANGAGPQVETVKKGDKVVRLIVTCSCGERIEIDCLYPAGG